MRVQWLRQSVGALALAVLLTGCIAELEEIFGPLEDVIALQEDEDTRRRAALLRDRDGDGVVDAEEREQAISDATSRWLRTGDRRHLDDAVAFDPSKTSTLTFLVVAEQQAENADGAKEARRRLAVSMAANAIAREEFDKATPAAVQSEMNRLVAFGHANMLHYNLGTPASRQNSIRALCALGDTDPGAVDRYSLILSNRCPN